MIETDNEQGYDSIASTVFKRATALRPGVCAVLTRPKWEGIQLVPPACHTAPPQLGPQPVKHSAKATSPIGGAGFFFNPHVL